MSVQSDPFSPDLPRISLCAPIDVDTWRTSYSRVSWAYDPVPASLPTTPQHRNTPHHSSLPSLYAKPPHYHASLFTRHHHPFSPSHPSGNPTRRTTSHPDSHAHAPAEDSILNPDLIGVQRTVDVLAIYEGLVGFDSAVPTPSDTGPASRCLARDIDPHLVSSGRERWQKMMREFTASAIEGGKTPSSKVAPAGSPSLRCPRSASVDPSPAFQRRCRTETSHSPSDRNISHARPASASPVVSLPSSLPPTPSPAFTNFTFPSLNDSRDSSLLPSSRIPLKQVSRGFHHDHPSSISNKISSSSSSPKSKTRALVTMLRAAAAANNHKAGTDKTPISSPSSSPQPADSPSSSSNASHNVDLDFFSRSRPPASEDGVETASSRSSPSPFADTCDDHEIDGWVRPSSAGPPPPTTPAKAEPRSAPERSPSSRPSPKRPAQPSLVANDDGWIEGPSQPYYHHHHRSTPKHPVVRKHTHRNPHTPMTAAAATHHPSLYPYIVPMPVTIPGPFLYPASAFYTMPMPTPAAAAAAQQMQVQMQLQQQQSLPRAPDGHWYPPPTQPVFLPAVVPRFLPGPHGAPPMVPLRYPGVPLVGPAPITGAAGMRHAVW